MSTKTAVLSYEYDEDQTTIYETFGTTAERMAKITSDILVSSKYRTVTSGVIGELEAGNISGGELLALATSSIAKVQHELRKAQKAFNRAVREGNIPENLGALLESLKAATEDESGSEGDTDSPCASCDKRDTCEDSDAKSGE